LIKVNGKPLAPAIIEGPTIVCPSVPVTYSVAVPSGTVAHWEVDNGQIYGNPKGSTISVSFDVQPAGPYVVYTYFEENGCFSDSLQTLIESEEIDLNFTGFESVVCGSSYAVYSVEEVEGADYYNW